MGTEAKIRIPKQKRSIEKKKQIKKATCTLMCTNGYHTITTNHIAKEAGLSIGTLYEYYPNKESILTDILNEYFEDFLNHEEAITRSICEGILVPDKQLFITELLHQQINSHRESMAFNRELHALCYSVPTVAAICSAQKNRLRQIIYTALASIPESLCISDLNAAAWLFMDMLDSTIDRVVFNPPDFEEERYIALVSQSICRSLFRTSKL